MPEKKYILIAEDDPISQFAISEMLKQEFNIHCVENGQQCLDSIQQKTPDILLLDINMPVLNGYETIKALRSQTQFHHLPIIIISALCKEKEITAGFAAGCDGYITKPFKQSDLLLKIKNLLFSSRKILKNKDNSK